jgi:N-acetylmuramoyl-L-alanine amidase
MQTHKYQRIWQYFQQSRMGSIVVRHIGIIAILVLIVLGTTVGAGLFGAFAQSPCSSGDQAYVVVGGDTLGGIATHYNTTWQSLAAYNHISNPNMIYVDETVCIPGNKVVHKGPPPVKGTGNYFPYGQCTWYANQRYYALHKIYVPWTSNSDAWAWTARAQNFHWQVSNKPSVGAIVDLQPWVQGAYGLGHVAVVEKVLSNGDVIASSMNWGVYYWEVVDIQLTPAAGVSFISF